MEKIKRFEDLPDDFRQMVEQKLSNHPTWKKLQIQQSKCIKKRDYIGEFNVRKKMQQIKDNIIFNLNNTYVTEVEDMNNISSVMTEDDKLSLNMNIHSLCFLADLLESYSLDAQQIIHKYHSDTNLVQYKALVALSKECKKQVKFIDSVVDAEYSEMFGDASDKIKELIDNKVKSFCRKIKARTNKLKKSK